ncbi:MAG: hypothetical protein ACK4E8_05150 [Lacibacter sp.]
MAALGCAASVTAQTFFAATSAPGDNGSQTGATVTITPPGGMATGDLVVLFAQYRSTAGTLSIAQAGGQNWIAEDAYTGSTQNTRIFWCRYNGTWSASPQVTAGAGNTQALTVVMYVFRPANANSQWAIGAPPINSTSSTNPNTINGITTDMPNAVVLAFWSSAQATTWGSLSGTGWSKSGLAAQVRNTATSGQSHTAAYRIMTSAGTVVNVAQTQSTAVNTLRSLLVFYEVRPANMLLGKSFINISKPNGGTVTPGDELEIRVSMYLTNSVGTNNRLYRMRFNDTVPTGLTYVPNSMRLLTNEAKITATYTDAPGDDFGFFNSSNRTLRINLGRDTIQAPLNMPVGFVSSTTTDTTEGGGYYNASTHRPRAGGGVLIIIAYRVTVDAVPFNTIINYGPGAVRFRTLPTAYKANDQTRSPNSLSFIVYPNYGLCNNATGSNSISPGNGNFGSGTDHNGPSPGPAVPGYNFVSIATGNPGDGNYSVVKNLSPSQNTNMFMPRPQSPNVDRVFGVWDIIGDHTGAADPLAGNPPPGPGQPGGYMLAVNAAYQLSIANNQTITGLCENTFYEFSAWFRNVCKRCGIDSMGNGASGVTVSANYIPTKPGDSSGVKPNLTFMIDGVDYYNSGELDYIGQWGQWVKKGFVFKTGPGQTSLTISIKNNAPGGGGNDWVMDDISFATCLPELQFFPTAANEICQNAQVFVSSIVNTFFDNYLYFQWERSTDGGATWHPAPLKPDVDSFTYVFNGSSYVDTVYYPTFIATPLNNGHQFRLRVATSIPNLSNGNCNIYQATEIVTLNVGVCNVLAATVTELKGQIRENNFAQLRWETTQEQNNAWFEVERSTDGRNFTFAGKVYSANGNSNVSQYYQFNDPIALQLPTHYRLKIVGEDGRFGYSKTILLQPQSANFALQAVVNPVKDRMQFVVQAPRTEMVTLQLVDFMGRKVKEEQRRVQTGSNPVQWQLAGDLQSGNYIMLLRTSTGVLQQIIQKL